MTPEAYCTHLAQRIQYSLKKRVRYVPDKGWFRVYSLGVPALVGPVESIERAWLMDQNYFKARNALERAQSTEKFWSGYSNTTQRAF